MCAARETTKKAHNKQKARSIWCFQKRDNFISVHRHMTALVRESKPKMQLLSKERLPATVAIDGHDIIAWQPIESSLARASTDQEKVASGGLFNHHACL